MDSMDQTRKLAPEHWIRARAAVLQPELAYSIAGASSDYRRRVGARLDQVLGTKPVAPSDDRFSVQADTLQDGYRHVTFSFFSEHDVEVPCHLLIPDVPVCEPPPVVVGLQGHSTGMHVSIGRAIHSGTIFDDDAVLIDHGEDYAVRAVRQGYVGLAIEQRGMGARRNADGDPSHVHPTCDYQSKAAMLIGTTMARLRTWDVQRALDCVGRRFPNVDTTSVGIVGNSGGGTTSYLTACLDPRIKVAMPSCSICTYDESILAVEHCICNYIPGMGRSFEYADLACLLVPKRLIVCAGRRDPIFRIDGVQRSYATISQIYMDHGYGDRCRLYVGEGGHQFFPESWPAFFDAMEAMRNQV